MRTVILRDDDTNALTPIEHLETLYRPFLARGLPVNLATIPDVRRDARTPAGAREGFVPAGANGSRATVPLAENRALVEYLQANRGYRIVQHGCHHDPYEFERDDSAEVVRRLEHGRRCLDEAGFAGVRTFVAPHDRFSPTAYAEVAARFGVISSGWFERRRLPRAWHWRYWKKKLLRQPHWRIGETQLLSHPGCLLSYLRPLDTMLAAIEREIERRETTVLVTHWWEYFRDGRTNTRFIAVLHALAERLAQRPDVRVIGFDELVPPVAGESPSAVGLSSPGGAACPQDA